MANRSKSFIMYGGWEAEDPYLIKDQSTVIGAANYEQKPEGGYRRISGYELYDGSASPSGLPNANRVLAAFDYQNRRIAIQSDGANNQIYLATGSGWQQLHLGWELAFDSGSIEIFQRDFITGNTSGAIARVESIYLTGGDWSTGDAEGYIFFRDNTLTGNFINNEPIDRGGTLNLATTDGVNTLVTLNPGGTYDIEIENFTGDSARSKAYLANGVDYGIELFVVGGSTDAMATRIRTNQTNDTPDFVTSHKNHLVLGFKDDGATVISTLGDPLDYITNPFTFAHGFRPSGYERIHGYNLLIMFREDKKILYGSGATDWELRDYPGIGGAEFTIQTLGDTTVYYSADGVADLGTTDRYGDFSSTTITYKISDEIRSSFGDSLRSILCREKDQYRLYFNDGRALYCTMKGRKLIGAMPIQLDFNPVWVWGGRNQNGVEWILYGDSFGNVFRSETAETFNGTPIESYLRFSFSHQAAPQYQKRYRHLFITGGGYDDDVTLQVGSQFDLSIDPDGEDVLWPVNQKGSSFWDLDTHNNFNWDYQPITEGSFDLTGSGKNVSVVVYSNGAEVNGGKHDIDDMVLNFEIRKYMRH